MHQHAQLAVGQESRQHTASVVVVKQLTSKLKVQLVAELSDTLLDLFGLYLEILFYIKTFSHISLQYGVQSYDFFATLPNNEG